MTPEWLQYGALGLLAAVLFGGYKLGAVLVARIATAFDNITKALDSVRGGLEGLTEKIHRHETEDERRHALTRDAVRDEIYPARKALHKVNNILTAIVVKDEIEIPHDSDDLSGER